MERKIIFSPAFDMSDKDPSKNYGVHGVNIKFLLSGEEGTVQFVLFTNWHLPHVQARMKHQFPPMPAYTGYHSSPKPLYEGQDITAESYEYLGEKSRYYDSSGLMANDYFDVLVAEGGEALWKKLEEYYDDCFDIKKESEE